MIDIIMNRFSYVKVVKFYKLLTTSVNKIKQDLL